ncbi:MAG: hypothetical protein H5U02_14755 [Clostridia bacterium]|nr:hypothetical protein [Clostridia bacterium]
MRLKVVLAVSLALNVLFLAILLNTACPRIDREAENNYRLAVHMLQQASDAIEQYHNAKSQTDRLVGLLNADRYIFMSTLFFKEVGSCLETRGLEPHFWTRLSTLEFGVSGHTYALISPNSQPARPMEITTKELRQLAAVMPNEFPTRAQVREINDALGFTGPEEK